MDRWPCKTYSDFFIGHGLPIFNLVAQLKPSSPLRDIDGKTSQGLCGQAYHTAGFYTFHLKEVTDARSIQGEGEAGDERADS